MLRRRKLKTVIAVFGHDNEIPRFYLDSEHPVIFRPDIENTRPFKHEADFVFRMQMLWIELGADLV